MAKQETNELSFTAVESGGIDLSEFDGTKHKIVGMEKKEVQSKYDLTGNELPAGQTIPIDTLRVFTEKITELSDKDGNTVEVVASELFNVKWTDDNSIEYSTNDRAKFNIFLKKVGVSKPEELIGAEVLVKHNKTTGFLGFYF